MKSGAALLIMRLVPGALCGLELVTAFQHLSQGRRWVGSVGLLLAAAGLALAALSLRRTAIATAGLSGSYACYFAILAAKGFATHQPALPFMPWLATLAAAAAVTFALFQLRRPAATGR